MAVDMQSLVQQAAKTRVDCRDVCGTKASILYSVTNLYGVLRRIRQESTIARSSLHTSASPNNKSLTSLRKDSTKILTATSDFLHASKTLGNYEDRIVGSWELGSFTEGQRSVIDHFDSEIMRLAYTGSRLLIVASAESLGELREQLDYGTGSPLSPILNDLTARLMANGDVRLSMLVKGPENEQTLWDALQHELLGISLDKAFLHRHKKVVLRYVRALERRSGFSGDPEAPAVNSLAKMIETVQNSSAKRRSLGDEEESGEKRRRTSGERLDDPQNAASQIAHLTTRNGGMPFRFRDPRTIFGPDVDNDLLADFLEEHQPAQAHTLRDRMRDIYRVLCKDYELKYEMTIFFEAGQKVHDEKKISGLIHEIENNVVMKLDNLELGKDEALRNLRKMMIDKAQKILDDLEKIKAE
ncbi:MAG: hypothetical protein LQ337_002686 [Flavoplaca oasis]|nr:MAG: hypothetical protein LQ337_002686 [Flavoplaca oasis]